MADKGKAVQVTIAHGANKHKLSAPAYTTVHDLQDRIAEETGVPRKSQKLLMKGRVLNDLSKRLSDLTSKSRLKLMLIGEKESPEVVATKKALAEIKQQIEEHAKELETHEETWKGLSEGYLPAPHVPEALKRLKKAVLRVNEMNVRLLERMDSLPIHKDMTNLRTTRKMHIAAVEKLLARGDAILKGIEERG